MHIYMCAYACMCACIDVCLCIHMIVHVLYVLTYVYILCIFSILSLEGVVTRSTAALWRDNLTNYGHQMLMNEQQIDELKDGLEFGKALRLPSHLAFSTVQIHDVINKSPVQHFNRLRLAVITLQMFVHDLLSV